MTERFQAELAARGRDWSDTIVSGRVIGYLFEQMAPDESVIASGLIRSSKRAEMTREFLAQDNQNAIVFYPLYEGDLPMSVLGGEHD
jgi:hypothetical protein